MHVHAVAPAPSAHARGVAPPCTMVVFGVTGDLTHRKLVPALYTLASGGRLDERFALVGVARAGHTIETLRERLRDGVADHARRPLRPEIWERLAAAIDYIPGEFDDPGTYRRLADHLRIVERDRGLPGGRLFYLATPPAEFAAVLGHLREAGLVTAPGDPRWTRVIVEKPFGRDLASAHALNGVVASVLDESQAFRIDHYLGKETVQNILVMRFANSLFEPIWNRKYVEYVEITAAEDIGIGSRGAFYDRTGVLRDMVQSHLLDLLCLTAMEPPTTGGADDVRGEKLKVLQALRRLAGPQVRENVVLGQYRGYRDEPRVAKDSTMPTFAALRVHVDNWRWQGVPFYLRTGKKLARQLTEISVHLQRVPLCLFDHPATERVEGFERNVLTLRIQPDEGIELRFNSKVPGDEVVVAPVAMDMNYVETFGGEPPEAYERLLIDAMRGDATLFLRRDWVEASWAWLDPILAECERPGATSPDVYEPESWGPRCCDEWMAAHGYGWRGA